MREKKKQLLSWYEIALLQALLGLFLGEEKVHSSTAGFRISRVFQGRLKLLISHVPLLSETMCFYSADYMLIAKVGKGGGEGVSHVQPTLCCKHVCMKKKTALLNAERPKRAGKVLSALSDLYRSWVPDEDLGMSIGVLICWDLEVSHQHLHSFPTESQRGHARHPPACLTFQLAANNTKGKSPARLAGDDPSMNGAEQQLNKTEQIESVLSPVHRVKHAKFGLHRNTGER